MNALTVRSPDLLASARRRWAAGAAPDAQAVLAQHPERTADRSFVLDLAYEEFCARLERGEAPDIEDFCDRFPEHRTSLRRLLNAHQFLEENEDLLEPAPPENWPQAGEVVGDLTLVRELGRGAFARVFLAREATTGDRLVVVKLTSDGLNEARTLGPLDHPHIVPVLSARADTRTGLGAVCMPYVGEATFEDVLARVFPKNGATIPASGQLLRRIARAGQPEPTDGSGSKPASYEEGVLRLVMELAEALTFLHARGICHRDLKPTNVLLSFSGRALLLDFNLSADGRLSGDRLGGTLPYMAPEQIRAMADKSEPMPGPAADVFALGVIAHEMLTGKHPYAPVPRAAPVSELRGLLLERQLAGPASLTALNPRLESGPANLLRRCLQADPASRPTAEQLAAGLHRRFTPREGLRGWLTRRPRAALTAGLIFLVLTTFGMAGFGPPLNEGSPEPNARQKADEAFLRGRDLIEQKPKQWRLALDAFREAGGADPNGRTLAAMAYCEVWLRHPDSVLELSREAIAKGFITAKMYNLRGYVLSRMSEVKSANDPTKHVRCYEQAKIDFTKAIQLDDRLQAAYYNRAYLEYCRAIQTLQPPPPEALEDMRQAIKLAPITSGLMYDAARLFGYALKTDRTLLGETIEYVRRAVELGANPDRLRSEANLPLLDHLRGDAGFEQALKTKKLGNGETVELRLIDPIEPD